MDQSKVALMKVLMMGLCLNLCGAIQVGFYSSICPNAESIVKSTVEEHFRSDSTIAAALLRLHYHDCFVQGCDGSVLISGPNAERTSPGHAGLRGFDVIESAKTRLEQLCPGRVSCADIVALAARDAVALSSGPQYNVPTGRKDGLVSNKGDASDMPDPADSVQVLKRKFFSKGLSAKDLVVLNAAHTIGTTACFFVADRLYNFGPNGEADPSIDPGFLVELEQTCPKDGDVNVRLDLDNGSQLQFDTHFLENVREGKGVLLSDSNLYQDFSTRPYIDSYFGLLGGLLGPSFESDFADSMVKMGQVGVKTGINGKIRRVCSIL